MEIEFPIEFLVYGTPVSLQRRRRAAREGWKELVRSSCAAVLPEAHFASDKRLGVTLYYFPDADMVGDLDNVIKLTLDALVGHVFINDSQIERVEIQKFEPDRLFEFSNPTDALLTALEGEKPVLFVRVADDLQERLS